MRYLRTLIVTFIIGTALILAGIAATFKIEHLNFYNARQAQAKFGISQADLTVVKAGQTDYAWTIPRLAGAFNFLRQPAALITLIYLPALAISLYEIRRLSAHPTRSKATSFSSGHR